MSSGDGATNWKTNVNRAKTKRWVEAKSYTYDGDDWGDADEYGEYGGYDEESEQPPPKPTGLRQAGKTGSPANAQSQPTQAPLSQQPQVSKPLGQPQPPYQQPDRERASSFGRGDDRRAFSGPNPAYAQPLVDRTGSPASRGSPPNAVPQHRMRAPSDGSRMQQQQPRPSFDQARPTGNQGYPNRPPWADGSRSQSLTSSSPGDYQRREFSQPSAAPQPLQTRPPRKSSLGQSDAGPPGVMQPIQTNIPENAPQLQSPQQQNAPTPTLIRPADIYRRMQEEKEKERSSQESSRPSIDTLQKSRDASPAGTSDVERKQRKPTLESVAERKSEYGMEGLLRANNNYQPTNKPSGSGTSPVLPQLSSFDGFGQGFGDSFMSTPEDKTSQADQTQLRRTPSNTMTEHIPNAPATSISNQPSESVDLQKSAEPTTAPKSLSPEEQRLRHQGSLGFRSAVNQAFDSQIPPTPTSTSDSNLDRSNSESTNDISPIISRNVSGAATRPTKEEIPSISSIAEEPATTPRSSTPTTSRPPGDRPDSKGSLQALRQGHRRNISTPSPDNSPARTPNVEVSRQLQSPQEAELAVTTPITASHTTSSASEKPRKEEENPASRSSSPTKGRVRDLVDKLDSANNSRRGSDASSKAMNEQSPRPQYETQESFRPQLPGGWSSYTTNDMSQHTKNEPEPTTSGTTDPFAAAAAAGSALAGALATATGVKSQETHDDDVEGTVTPKDARRASTKNLAIYPEAQRLSLPRNDSDAPSSIVPTPMYMKPEGSEKEQEYFAPVTPLNQRRQQAPTAELPQLESTKAYEDMSTESSPNDLESDRLRKELVRELSPQAENFDQAPTSHPQDTSPATQPQGRESTFLPSEYDSYWNAGSADGGDASRKASELGSLPTGSPIMPTQTQFSPMNQGHPAPMNAQVQNQRQFSGSQNPPLALVQPIQESDETRGAFKESNSSAVAWNPKRLSRRFSWEGPPEAGASDAGTPTASSIAASQLKNEITSESPLPTLPAEARHQHTPSTQSVPDVNKELPRGPEGLEESPITNLEAPRPEPTTVSDEQTNGSSPSVPISQQSQPAKIPAFRDIKAIKDVNERLRAYDNTREQFAGMNTGLSSWIHSTIKDHPEHAELLRNGGSFGLPIRPAVQAVGRSTTQGFSNSPASKPAFTPSAGKVTSAKGKDLLHTAGVFSGKANTAAKGFFSKGRSKLRGMGGDKAPRMFRRPSYPIATVDADSSPTVASETVAQPVPSNQTTPSHIPLIPRSFTEPPSLENPPSFEIPPPTFPPPPDQVDSPTLGVELVQGSETPRASVDTPVSPISASASFENRRASLQQKRASQRLSLDNHAASSSEYQTRLTIHQNQMKSFEESFPPDLIIPAKYQNLPANPDDPKRKTAEDHTPTQADFPADTKAKSNTDDTSGPKRLVLDTQALPERSNSYDIPASPDYAIAADSAADESNGTRENRASSLSFIQFADIHSEGFSLKTPETPRHLKFHRESQSTFDDTAFESPERDLDHVVSAESGSRHSVQQPTRSTSKSSRRRGSQPRSTSTRSSLRRVLSRGSSKENDVEQLDSPTIPSDTFRVREQEEIKKQPTVSLFPKTKRRSQQLATVAKYPNPVLQEVPATPSTAVESPTRKKRQRSSLLGNFGLKGVDSSPKSRLGFHKRADTDLPSHGTPVQLTENDIVAAPIHIESEPQPLQRSATVNQSPLENGKKKGRFSGLSSFIGKANPKRQGSGVSTLRTVSPFSKSKLESTPEKPRNQTPPLHGAQRPAPPFQNVSDSRKETPPRQTPLQASDQGYWRAEPNARPAPPTESFSSTREEVPKGRRPSHTSNLGQWHAASTVPSAPVENIPSSGEVLRERKVAEQNSARGHWRAPSHESQASGDYKSVFPPEFYANEPLQGYYGSPPEPRQLPQDPAHERQVSTSSISDSAPRTAYAATAMAQKQNSVNKQFSNSRHSQSQSAIRNQSSTSKKPPSPKRETIRSIESNLFDIETPPPPPPKDARYTPSPSNKQTSLSRRPKRNSTPVSSTKVTFSNSPIATTTTTTTTTTRHKRHSISNSTGRSKHRSSSSVGDVPSNPVSPISTIKPSKSSIRRSLPPLQTKNFVSVEQTSRRESNSAAPQLTGTTQNFSPQTMTVHAPTVTSTTTVTGKSPENPTTSTIIHNQPLEPIYNEPVVEQQPPKPTTEEAKQSPKPSTTEETALKIKPPPRQSSPVEKMKDEPRSASHANTTEGNADATDSDDEIVMSSTAYPGQEWRPDFGYGGWEGD